jgi:dTDP-glucose 4,6-dehydratase
MRILVTGGAGFIGSNFVRYLLKQYPSYKIIVLDKLTYAGNLDNLQEVFSNSRFEFIKGDICDKETVENIATRVDCIVNFAAETHVDRSLQETKSFVLTDVLGTVVLLEATRKYSLHRFVQISTDEVYGSISKGSFDESSPLAPSSPYSASKAAADLEVLAYWKSFKVPVVICRSSNNFGPYQHPEKLIPLFITNLLEGKKVPLYGDGRNVRDWLYVEDNCRAIDLVLHQGKVGEIYNIGAGCEKTNLEITHQLLSLLGKDESFIQWVKDRPGHDQRYSLSVEKIKALGWEAQQNFHQLLADTVRWYQKNTWWWQKIKTSAEFKNYYQKVHWQKESQK